MACFSPATRARWKRPSQNTWDQVHYPDQHRTRPYDVMLTWWHHTHVVQHITSLVGVCSPRNAMRTGKNTKETGECKKYKNSTGPGNLELSWLQSVCVIFNCNQCEVVAGLKSFHTGYISAMWSIILMKASCAVVSYRSLHINSCMYVRREMLCINSLHSLEL